jgi:pyridoxine/pyridoxamine 5'-phosphate oxidase
MLDEPQLERIWMLFERAAKNRRDAFHTPALATMGLAGEPQVRTMVLRRFEREPPALFFHVDLRSPKIAEIERDSHVSCLFYDAAEKLQLRIRGRAIIHRDDELSDRQWRESTPFSLRAYCGDAPGTPKSAADSGLPEVLRDREPTAEESEILGRKNFSVVRSTVEEIDAYELNVRGHRRVLFKFHESGEIEKQWLTP